MENLIERLGLQSDAFQEGFSILSRAKSLEELSKKFFHVLRGNLLVVNAAILYKQSDETDWKLLFSKTQNTDIPFYKILDTEVKPGTNPAGNSEFKIAIKHSLIDKSVVGILLGSKLDNSAYTEFDRIVLQFFLQQFDSAYQFYISRKKEKKLIFELNHRVLQLNSLIDTGIEITRLRDNNQLLHLALERVLALTNASKGMLQIKKGRKILENIYYPFTFKSKKNDLERYQISTYFEFAEKKYDFYLFEKESREGLIKFDATDQLLLDAFARQVYASLENQYFHEQSLENERINNEISLAGTIQKKLIPEELPEIDGYDQCGINIPTKYIGGDFYDCIPLKDGRFMLIMADVSGKGVPAGLLVSTLHASVHAFVDSPFELASLVQKLNTVIYEASTIEKYITAFFALLDPKTGKLESVNAGHNPSYILNKNKKVDELKTGGVPLGMMDIAFPYESTTSLIKPGDRLLLYTDGVTEALNEKEEEYDDVRPLKDFFISNQSPTAKNFIDELIIDVQNFTGETPQSDDITALYLIREN